MNCDFCGKEFDEFEGYVQAVDSEQKITLENADQIKKESLCSTDCLKKHIEKCGNERYNYAEIYFCPGARECAGLDNLRKLCSRSERIKFKESNVLDSLSENISSLVKGEWCEPGIAGMIKTNMKLHQSNLEVVKSIKNFDRISTILSGIMIVLTIVILIATVAMYLKG